MWLADSGGVLPLFNELSPLHRALDYHAERHNVLASNVANANTPGFRPSELLRGEELRQNGVAPPLPMARTTEAHAAAPGTAGDQQLVRVEDRSVRGGLDGNAVSLEREMAKLGANDLRYQGAAQMVSRTLGALRYAATDGQG